MSFSRRHVLLFPRLDRPEGRWGFGVLTLLSSREENPLSPVEEESHRSLDGTDGESRPPVRVVGFVFRFPPTFPEDLGVWYSDSVFSLVCPPPHLPLDSSELMTYKCCPSDIRRRNYLRREFSRKVCTRLHGSLRSPLHTS